MITKNDIGEEEVKEEKPEVEPAEQEESIDFSPISDHLEAISKTLKSIAIESPALKIAMKDLSKEILLAFTKITAIQNEYMAVLNRKMEQDNENIKKLITGIAEMKILVQSEGTSVELAEALKGLQRKSKVELIVQRDANGRISKIIENEKFDS